MNKPHKHAELIKAWADGAEIEYYAGVSNKWIRVDSPFWDENIEYRIKPTPTKKKCWVVEVIGPLGIGTYVHIIRTEKQLTRVKNSPEFIRILHEIEYEGNYRD